MRKLIKQDVDVLRCIHKGQAHKTSKKQLITTTGLSKRAVYDSIEALRAVGFPIMASRNSKDSGYYLAETDDEKQAGIAQYKKQIATEQRNLSQLEQTDINSYLSAVADDPVLWRELGSDLLEVTTTSDGATIRIKDTL